jgi:hypothetical protein
MTALDKRYGYARSHRRKASCALLHSAVLFESPVVHALQRGRDINFKYLASAVERFAGGASPVSAHGATTRWPSSRPRSPASAQWRRYHHLLLSCLHGKG